MARVNKRQTTTVHRKKTYTYNYRQTETGKFIRLSGKGYQESTKLTKLQFKNGKLTKAGEALIKSIREDPEISEARRRSLLNKFEDYRKANINRTGVLTLERWNSHLIGLRIERMIYNFGMTPEEIAEITSTTVADVLTEENWDFDKKTYLNNWVFEYDYDSFNGFRFTKVNE